MSGAATRESWKALPLPEAHEEIRVNAKYTDEEFAQISQGRIPQGMDDKWFMFVEGETLFIHRSWTGYLIYQVEFENQKGQHRVKRVLVNRDPNQHRREVAEKKWEIQFVRWLIEHLLLGRDMPLPRQKSDPLRAHVQRMRARHSPIYWAVGPWVVFAFTLLIFHLIFKPPLLFSLGLLIAFTVVCVVEGKKLFGQR